ncbi:CPBP family intramembrane metalloprotease [Clostridium perfringens]|uniref:CPBP family intramembrane glutamic endopeptidase n=1 Tax=Clostridium perfringens TaxID=1502 RepID=UPI001A2E96D5|nr:CPBP family intramembrane glutamic endopeptidase [Clostridium perfringens]MBO3326988.1 CPBP family intramembrane metalloprotease [Clostridium perfringens]HAT4262556.1 CPBP family intramembrane metalloprotease [Clostridium perfringens]HAT4356333.1 CPBP family intramembrane metalloprotease [Clostridium perfringens]
MNIQNKLKETTVFWKIVITLCMTILPLQLLLLLQEDSINPYKDIFIFIITIILSFIVIKIIGKPVGLSMQFSNMKMLITKGWYVVLSSIILGILNLISVNFSNIPNTSQIFIFLATLTTGVIFEEITFRGIIQNILVDKYISCGKNPWKAIILSSLIFGSMHFLNLIGKPYFILGTITQVLYTLSLGIMIGVVYYLSKNIWTAIILHLIFNLFGSYVELFENSTNIVKSDLSLIGMIIQLSIMLPGIYIAFRIYKKNKKIISKK